VIESIEDNICPQRRETIGSVNTVKSTNVCTSGCYKSMLKECPWMG
jgi:hypothetical protein